MKTIQRMMLLFAVLLVLGSCSPLRLSSDYDRKVNFAPYKTYNFYEKGLAKLRLNELDKRRVLAALETEMAAKGFTKADNANMLVNVVVVSRERVDVYNDGPNYWGWWGWYRPYWGRSAAVDQYSEGTIIIDFIDAKNNQLIWHGQGMGFNLDNYKKREERLQAAVKDIVAQYPPKP